ncbi:hypothetical protein [Moorena bouillonii]|uniref:hypothetical protein n=1 Tax=Moorena bouillonii TaxID=207920 RepID=UPI001417F04E|nr:hypothetical protein [Moorena bouillonii]NEO50081.1 hypothetical protein [Moorena sp. SIO4A3]
MPSFEHILPDGGDWAWHSLPRFRPFLRPIFDHRFYSFHLPDYFDDLGQSILPILFSEITICNNKQP